MGLFICFKMRILFKSEDTYIKCASFVICCQTTAFAVHHQYTTCTCTEQTYLESLISFNEIKITVTYQDFIIINRLPKGHGVVLSSTLIMPSPAVQALSMFQSILLSLGKFILVNKRSDTNFFLKYIFMLKPKQLCVIIYVKVSVKRVYPHKENNNILFRYGKIPESQFSVPWSSLRWSN
jgi:hypothetical protein